MIVLQNLTSSAPWEPRYYCLNAKNATWIGRRGIESAQDVHGIGSTCYEITERGLCKRLLAFYRHSNDWFIFDGKVANKRDDVVADWRSASLPSRLLGIAVLRLEIAGSVKDLVYVRPWLRHCFEGGWALEDVDIAWLIPKLASDEASRQRLLHALQAEDEQRGPI